MSSLDAVAGVDVGSLGTKTVIQIIFHAKGAHYLHPQTPTIIDMGGQDCKAIRLDEDGNVSDFAELKMVLRVMS